MPNIRAEEAILFGRCTKMQDLYTSVEWLTAWIQNRGKLIVTNDILLKPNVLDLYILRKEFWTQINGSVQDCLNFIANALELPLYC